MKKFIYLFLVFLTVACSDDDNSNLNNDIMAPVITILGEANVSILQFTNYIDAGATAEDNVDGDLTSNIVTTGSVNTEVIGSYIITYTVSDAAGNIATASRQVTVIEGNPVYLDTNGITIKAREWAEVGATGVINGITYTVVDEQMLRGMVENEEDVTKLATTKVTDMATLLSEEYTFNQDIGNWDVSNVTNMSGMFYDADSFNQDISNWDVSSVTSMYYMFSCANVFNQDIGNWDVSNVTTMSEMFYWTDSFNQDIGNWDVSNVTNMGSMFWSANLFNQDLIAWNVDGVVNCEDFDYNTPQWILSKPNFTNCTP